MRIVCSLWCLLVLVQMGYTQISIHKNPESNVPIKIVQWEVNDLIYQLKKETDNPFSTKAFALVTGGHEAQKIPLFYNGNNQWVFRFSSSEVGEKSFVIESEIKELNGKKGSFIISKNKKGDRHGGIVRNNKYPRRLFYEDGSHYFNLAFECDWLFALDYGKEDLSKTEHLLSRIQENGFNQIVMNVYAYDPDTDWVRDEKLKENPQHDYGAREDIFPFLGSNSHPDYSSLNVDFFRHFDKVIALMNEHEIVAHLMIYVWNKRVAWPEPGSEADDMYYDHVVQRYQAFPNIIWDVSKEATSKIALSQNKNIVEHIRERAIRTRELDAYHRLVSVHAYGFCKNNPDVVDFISIQNWKLTIYEEMLDAYRAFPGMPVFNIEHGGYEESPYEVFPGGYSNAEVCLRRNYQCLFAGTYTTYYWQGAAWNAIIHNPFEQPDNMIKPHFEYFKYMRKLFDRVDYEKFEPVTGYTSRSYNLTNYEDGIILLYFPKEVHQDDIRQQLEKEFNWENATQQWFNTLTGEFTEEVKLEFKHKYNFWDWRPWRHEADAIWIISNLEPKN